MRTVSLAARRWYVSTWIASGARPIAAPPLTMATFDPLALDGADLLYVCAHGLPDQGYWYGSDWSTMVSAAQIELCRLPGAVVLLMGCYGVGPMSDACIRAGAAAVIADAEATHAGYVLPTGSNAVGRLISRALARGLSAGRALAEAKEMYFASHGERSIPLLDSLVLIGDEGAIATGVNRV